MLAMPWIIYCDWNNEPHELAASGWLGLTNSKIIIPRGAVATCSGGKGRLLDYLVVSRGAEYFVESLELAERTPWKSHKGLDLALRRDGGTRMGWKLDIPKRFPRPPERP
eukprot:12341346-Heterocapsa_arctica.AAC.1